MTKNAFCLFGLHQWKTITRHTDNVEYEFEDEVIGHSGSRKYRIHTIQQQCDDCGKEIVRSYKVKAM